MKNLKLAALFGLAVGAGACASLGGLANDEPSPFNETDRCIEKLAQHEASMIAGSQSTGMVRIEPLLFREFVRACTAQERQSPSFYRNMETIFVHPMNYQHR